MYEFFFNLQQFQFHKGTIKPLTHGYDINLC